MPPPTITKSIFNRAVPDIVHRSAGPAPPLLLGAFAPRNGSRLPRADALDPDGARVDPQLVEGSRRKPLARIQHRTSPHAYGRVLSYASRAFRWIRFASMYPRRRARTA